MNEKGRPTPIAVGIGQGQGEQTSMDYSIRIKPLLQESISSVYEVNSKTGRHIFLSVLPNIVYADEFTEDNHPLLEIACGRFSDSESVVDALTEIIEYCHRILIEEATK